MSPFELERLKRQYAGKQVLVVNNRPELAQYVGLAGKVITINSNGRALVQFEGADTGWHDLDPACLKLEPTP
jgi:hypothetical protein